MVPISRAAFGPNMYRTTAVVISVVAGSGLLLRQDSAPIITTLAERLSPMTSVALMEIPATLAPEPAAIEAELADPVSEDPSTSPTLDPLYFEPESPETDRYLEAVIRRAGVGRDTLDPVALSRLGTLSCHRIESGTTYVSVVGEVARLGGRLPVRAADIVGASTETLCPSPRLALRDTTALR
jgi:hypothetical protein